MSPLIGSSWETAKSFIKRETSSTVSSTETNTQSEQESQTPSHNEQFYDYVTSQYIEGNITELVLDKSAEVRHGPKMTGELYAYAKDVIDWHADDTLGASLACDLLDVTLEDEIPYNCINRIVNAVNAYDNRTMGKDTFYKTVESALSGGAPFHYTWLKASLDNRTTLGRPFKDGLPQQWERGKTMLHLDDDGFYKAADGETEELI